MGVNVTDREKPFSRETKKTSHPPYRVLIIEQVRVQPSLSKNTSSVSIRALLNKSIFRHACGMRQSSDVGFAGRGASRRDGRLQGVGDRMKLSPRHSKLVGLALANTSKQINRKPHSTACARAPSRNSGRTRRRQKSLSITSVRTHAWSGNSISEFLPHHSALSGVSSQLQSNGN